MSSKLLLDEQPLVIQPKLATIIGLNEAIVLQQINYWLNINEKARVNYIDGRYWTYNPYPKWQDQFPFWSIDTIKRTITKLEKMGIVLSGNYNKNKFDKTKWYSIDFDKLDEIIKAWEDENEPNGNGDEKDTKMPTKPETLDSSKMPSSINAECNDRQEQDATIDDSKLHRPIPETTRDYKKDNNNNIGDVVVDEYQNKIDAVTGGHIPTTSVRSLLKTVGPEQVDKYIELFPDRKSVV